VTNYWDLWGSVLGAVFSGDERIPVPVFKEVLEDLIRTLHQYDHENGGHVLDTYCECDKSLKMKMEWLRCSLKTRIGGENGHRWMDDKCLYCKAPKSYFVKEEV